MNSQPKAPTVTVPMLSGGNVAVTGGGGPLGIIYTLACPFTGTVKYVGMTRKSINARLRDHIHDAKRDGNLRNKKNAWILNLLRRGIEPVAELLDTCNDKDVGECERYWIAQFRAWGFELKNHTSGGDNDFTLDEHTRRKIKEARAKQVITQDTRDKFKKIMIGNSRALGKKHSHDTRRAKSLRQIGSGRDVVKMDFLGNELETFSSISLAAKSVKVTYKAIWRACVKSKKSAGFKWKYKPKNKNICL